MSYKDILQTAPTLQAVSLVGGLAKKKKKKRIVGDAIDIIFGSSVIKTESDLIAGL